jgi:large subunit ribosomal protein L35Ae
MEGILVNFRLGKHTKSPNQMVLQIEGIDSKEKAAKLAGKEVAWKTPAEKANEIKGKISMPHGSKGAMRVIFERGMPGQAVGKKVKIL